MAKIRKVRSTFFAVLAAWTVCNAVAGAAGAEVPSPASGADPEVERERPTGGRRRAVLVGIDHYLSSPPPSRLVQPLIATGGRGWSNLEGAANDARAVRDALLSLYGFAKPDIVLLTDRDATRARILGAVEEHLVTPASAGDVVVFFFAGHGSRVANSLSTEPDRLDESIVPADSAQGAPDIRDKELRRLFNRILDRGARLTVVLDSCHSGSGARGLLTGAAIRSIAPDLRDLAAGEPDGPRPENRGALVLSAAQDFARAYETRDDHDRPHGAFTLALLRAMRRSAPDESSEETFDRARALLRVTTPYQEPVLAGGGEARGWPLFGVTAAQRASRRSLLAVERVEHDGSIVVAGGWIHGLDVGSRLRPVSAENGDGALTLETAELIGLTRSVARPAGGTGAAAAPPAPQVGDLLEVTAWATPDIPLFVSVSVFPGSQAELVALARELADRAETAGIRWIADPSEETPTHVVRWHGRQWELLTAGSEVAGLGAQPPLERFDDLVGPGSKLFLQLPITRALAHGLAIGSGAERDGVRLASRPEVADYVLVGRWSAGALEYSWLQPGMEAAGAAQIGLPVRTRWHPLGSTADGSDRLTSALSDDALRLRRIHAWHRLEPPAGSNFLYSLRLRRADTGEPVAGGELVGGETYRLYLEARQRPSPQQLRPRWIYIFVLDSHGRSVLLFPPAASGSIENRLPFPTSLTDTGAPPTIDLDPSDLFEVTEPYGVDTFFLLTSDEPIPNPWVLEWEPVRGRGPSGSTPLEELLASLGGAERAARLVTSASWSLERVVFRSVPRALHSSDQAPSSPGSVPAFLEDVGRGLDLTDAATEERLRAAIDHFRAVGDDAREGACHLLVGVAAAMRDPQAAAGPLETGLALLERSNDVFGAWMALLMLARLDAMTDHADRAEARYRRALELLAAARTSGEGITFASFEILRQASGQPAELPPQLTLIPQLIAPALATLAELLSLNEYGGFLVAQGDLDRAEAQLVRAAEGSARLGGIFDASIHRHLGQLRRAQWSLDEARESFQAALAAANTGLLLLPEVAHGEARLSLLAELAEVELLTGHAEKALARSEESVSLARSAGVPDTLATSLQTHADLLGRTGHPLAAEDALIEAVEVIRQAPQPDLEALLRADLASLTFMRGAYQDSVEHLTAALDSLRHADRPYLEAGLWAMLAVNYLFLDFPAGLGDSLARAEELKGHSGSTPVAHLVALIAAVDRWQRGELEWQAVFDLYESFWNEDYVELYTTEQTRSFFQNFLRDEPGTAVPEAPDAAGALPDFRFPQLIAILRFSAAWQLYHEGDPVAARRLLAQAMTEAERAGHDELVGLLLMAEGAIWSQEGQPEEAIDKFIQGVQRLETAATDLIADELLRGFFGSDHQVLYGVTINALSRVGRTAEAFSYAERARARSFLQMIGNRRLRPAAGADAELVAEAESMRASIRVWQQRVGLAAEPEREAIERDLAAARARYEHLLLRLKLSNPEYASVVGIQTLGLAEVQERLDEDTTLLSYFLSATGAHAWVIDSRSSEYLLLPLGDEVLSSASCWIDRTAGRQALSVRGAEPLAMDCGDRAGAETLYRALIRPLRQYLQSRRLMIVPHGILHALPFAALRDPETGRLLIEDFVLSYAPSASVLAFLDAKRSSWRGTALVLGDPVTARSDLQPLTAARREAATVARLLSTSPLLGAEATEDRLHEMGREIDILHVAAHGLYEPNAPQFSSLALAPGNGHDGDLEAHEVLTELDLTGVDLVVLSACDTARGRRTAGDEILGLSRAFLYAGSPAVIDTLWQVEDESAALLMEEMYGRLLAGVSADEALRDAQLAVRALPGASDPRSWAAFRIHGASRLALPSAD